MSKKPLVFHTFLKIDYAEIPSISMHINNLHKKLYDLGYIEKIEESISEVEFNLNTQERNVKKTNTWHFIDVNKSMGCAVNPEFLIVQTSNYESFLDFEEKFKEIFSIFIDIIHSILIREINFRYLNCLSETELDRLRHDRSIISMEPNARGYQSQHSMLEKIQVKEKDKFLVSRLVSSNSDRQHPLVPQDIIPFINKLQLKEEFQDLKGSRSTLDINCHFRQLRLDISESKTAVYNVLNEMHDDISSIFTDMIKE